MPPRRPAKQLTEAELRVMNVLWDRGRSTVADVAAELPDLAYNTVLTMLRILETKAFVTHEQNGRAFIYAAAVEREQAQTGAVKHLLSRFFNDSPQLLIANLLETKRITADELARVKKTIERKKREP